MRTGWPGMGLNSQPKLLSANAAGLETSNGPVSSVGCILRWSWGKGSASSEYFNMPVKYSSQVKKLVLTTAADLSAIYNKSPKP